MDVIEAIAGPPAHRHPWEEARFAFFRRTLAAAGLPAPGARVLDIGAGDAWFAGQLAAATGAELICWDVAYGRHPAPAVLPRIRLTAEPPRDRFPLVLALDVLEHVTDDAAFVRRIAADLLAPGGHVLVSVPAWPALFSRHDERLGHVRRYTPQAADALLRAAGLRPLRGGGLFHSLVVFRALQKWTPGLAGEPALAGTWSAPGWLTAIVRSGLSIDNAASTLFSRLGWEVPGLSWWALCRGP